MTDVVDPETEVSTPTARIIAARRKKRRDSLGAGFGVLVLVLAIVLIQGGIFDEDEKEPPITREDDLGMSYAIPVTLSHPALTVAVNEFSRTKSATPGVRVAKGQHLVSFRLAITNDGTTGWRGSTTGAVFVDVLDRSYQPDARFTAVEAGKAWPRTFRMRPGETRAAYVVFTVPENAEPKRLELTVGQGPDDTVAWQMPVSSNQLPIPAS